jgi:hypothetical protein
VKVENGKSVSVSAAKAQRKMEVYLHSFLTSTLDGSRYSNFTLGEEVNPEQQAGWAPQPVVIF